MRVAYSSSIRTTSQGVVPIGSKLFGTCTTEADAQIKIVNLSAFDVLASGVTIHVYFENENTAINAQLQVGSTLATNIYCNGIQNGMWAADSVVSFTYYNNRWYQNDVQDPSVIPYREEPNSSGGLTAIIG